MKKTLPLIILFAMLCASAAAQTKPSPQPVVGAVPASATDARQEAFDIVWRTVKEKHFDPTFGGVDWDKVRVEYAPRVAAAKNDSEFYQLLQKMLGELHQSHFAIVPPEVLAADNPDAPRGGGIGIDLRIIDGQAVITRVEPGLEAARAGLSPGFVIRQVGKETVEQLVERFAKSDLPPTLRALYITRAVLGRIEGAPGTTVSITFVDERDQTREASITREAMKGELMPGLGNFPPQLVEFESRRLAGGIGYIRFNVFVIGLMDKIRAAVRSMSDAPGIIFDLRGNPGGLGGMAAGIAGVLETKQTSLGVMKMRAGYINFAVFPQAGAFAGPVVILIDGLSASTSEVFASGMQEIGRARVVGERSAGAALPSIIQKLPTGALFQYAIADFKTPKGVLIEGRGVIPDVEIKLSRRALLEGRDSQLEAAVEQIKKLSAVSGQPSVK
ncbi:MAG TPA: S41 family peptidase [Blastocatellia bacterium]|nr:S41 family peptidase [Blastocatellia bacterium]